MIGKILKNVLIGAGAIVLAPFLLALLFILLIALTAVWSFVFNFTLLLFILMVQSMT